MNQIKIKPKLPQQNILPYDTDHLILYLGLNRSLVLKFIVEQVHSNVVKVDGLEGLAAAFYGTQDLVGAWVLEGVA